MIIIIIIIIIIIVVVVVNINIIIIMIIIIMIIIIIIIFIMIIDIIIIIIIGHMIATKPITIIASFIGGRGSKGKRENDKDVEGDGKQIDSIRKKKVNVERRGRNKTLRIDNERK